jgi:LAO/AO transport system kinase
MEVADILVVNKSDLSGADIVVSQLQSLLSFAPAGDWQPPVIKVSALRHEGIDELIDAVAAHRAHLRSSAEGARKLLQRARSEILAATQSEMVRRLSERQLAGELDALTSEVAERRIDPRSAARQLLAGLR